MPAIAAKKTTTLARIVALAAAAAAIAAPIFAVLLGAIGPAEAQGHIWSTTGLRYLSTTMALIVMVGIGATIIGAGAAMLVTLAEFPGRRIFSVLLVLPFAIPAYVAAYAYAHMLDPFGPVGRMLSPGTIPGVRSLGGAAFILTLTTYPYVYLAMRASLAARSDALMEAARSLGASPAQAARRILLGAGRPALIGGLALALMETAADYGVADYFGIQTLSVGIFRTWYGLGDLSAATQLAAGLFLATLLLMLMEDAGRRGATSESARTMRGNNKLKLSTLHAVAAIIACLTPVAFGFLIPAGYLLLILEPEPTLGAWRGLSQSMVNTGAVAAGGAAIAAVLALALAYAGRAAKGARLPAIMIRIATFGYAIPGAVIAIGILVLSSAIARHTGIIVAGGVMVLLYAYVARFLTASYNVTASGLAQISPQMDAAAKSLGAGTSSILFNLHVPMARSAILAGTAIVAIDITKELPATLLLRPFNFETLSTRIYRLASDERLADAAPAALILIAISLIPAILLSAFGNGKRH